MQIKKSALMMIGIAVLIILVGYFVLSKGSNGSDIQDQGEGTAQKIVIGMKNGNYYPNTITVKANTPVEMTLDSSVQGCYRSFNIKDLGVSKYSKSPSDTINFTPTKKGTFRFACSMGMGTGTLIVE